MNLKKMIVLPLILMVILTGCKPKVAVILPTLTPNPTRTLTQDTPPPVESEPVYANLSITYSCGDGFVLSAGEKKVLTDISREESRFLCQKDAESHAAFTAGQPPFDGIDLILVSHTDVDHFPPLIVGTFLQNNPETELVGSDTVVDELREKFTGYDQIANRIHKIQPDAGQTVKLTVQGIDLEVINLPGLIPNLGFLFKLGGLVIFDSGDLGLEPAVPDLIAMLQAYKLPERQVYLAFVQWSYLTEDSLKPILEEGIVAKNYVPMYFAGEDLAWALMSIPLSYPRAVLFQEELDTWTYNPQQP